MTEVAVDIPPAPGGGPAVESAHAAAVAEGAAEVHTEQAEQASGEAKAAAEVALSAAAANMETAMQVAEATEVAQSSAQEAASYAAMIQEALAAQTGAINALAEELRASRKSAVPEGKPARTAPDREPSGPQLRRR